jgi:hypothetical protein
MKIFLYSVLIILICPAALALADQPQGAEKSSLSGNMNSIMTMSNARLMANVIVLYNDVAFRSHNMGALKAAEATLLKKSIPLSLRYGNDRTNYNCFMALARCYVDQKKYSQAKWYFIQSNISAKKGKYVHGEVLSLVQLARLKRVIGDHKLALRDLKEAEKLAIKINFKSQLPDIRKRIAAFPGEEVPPAKKSTDAKLAKGS